MTLSAGDKFNPFVTLHDNSLVSMSQDHKRAPEYEIHRRGRDSGNLLRLPLGSLFGRFLQKKRTQPAHFCVSGLHNSLPVNDLPY
jgi:hypothetical protein